MRTGLHMHPVLRGVQSVRREIMQEVDQPNVADCNDAAKLRPPQPLNAGPTSRRVLVMYAQPALHVTSVWWSLHVASFGHCCIAVLAQLLTGAICLNRSRTVC